MTAGTLIRTDEAIQREVAAELKWDARIVSQRDRHHGHEQCPSFAIELKRQFDQALEHREETDAERLSIRTEGSKVNLSRAMRS